MRGDPRITRSPNKKRKKRKDENRRIVERAWVRVAREAVGPEGRVIPQQALAATPAAVPSDDQRRLDMVVHGATPRGEALCCDATLVSPLTRQAMPAHQSHRTDGAALNAARRRKELWYPELLGPGPQRLLVLACEVGGRWHRDCEALLRLLVHTRAPRAPPAVRASAASGWRRRWWSLLSVAVQQAVATTALSGEWLLPEAMTADTEERISTAEKDINQLFDDTSILFSGMKQMQKQQNYLMQRDQNQARKEANQQAIITGWPVDAQEQDRDRIVDWMVGAASIPAREFLYASHKVRGEVLSRISILHFRSVWATKKFLESARRITSDRHPLPYWHSDNSIPRDSSGTPYFLRVKQQISTPDRIRSIPMKAFLQLINDTPNCEYHQETRNLHKNWAANIIATENGNLLKCVFNDADGTVKLLIREDLFPMAEEGLATAWKKVATRHSDEDFTTQEGKGKGKAKSSSSTARGVQDYLYKVHLVRVRPLEDDEDP